MVRRCYIGQPKKSLNKENLFGSQTIYFIIIICWQLLKLLNYVWKKLQASLVLWYFPAQHLMKCLSSCRNIHPGLLELSKYKLESDVLSRVCHYLLTLQAKWQRSEGSLIAAWISVLWKHHVVVHCCQCHLLIPASLLHPSFSLVHCHCLQPFQTCFKTGFDILWKSYKTFYNLVQPRVR